MESTSCTNIKVAIRMRPLIASEEEKKLSLQWSFKKNNIYQIDEFGQKCGDSYSFDHIFGINKTNKEIYNEIVKDFVISSMNGLNTTIFAYGQTSSGKTYTMLGDKKSSGVMTLAVDNIFDIIEDNISRKYLIRVSYIEIYNEKINDLLDPKNKDLKIREFGLQNVKEEIVSRKEQMYNCLKTGNLNRHIGSTKANERSSRSHTIFKITIESTQANDLESSNNSLQISSINLVDLAGSERVAQTKATGMRLIEGSHINKSLSALGLVIRQLSDNQEFVNFRDSKLTRLLQDSLGGNSKTLIIATITLASIDDTNSTLAFAQRAKAVKNKPHVNEILSDAEVSKRHANLNAQLKKKLEQQMFINQELQRTRDENIKEMARLQQQMQMLEDFHNGSGTLESQALPKRRHTIGFSSHKKKLFFSSPKERTIAEGNFSGLTTIFEDSPDKQIELGRQSMQFVTRRNETPEELLRTRLEKLQEDYTELATFTRDENNILNEATEKAEEYKSKLQIVEIELEKYKTKSKQEEESSVKKSEVSSVLDELLILQSILRNVKFQNECVENQDNAVNIIESFYFKLKEDRNVITKAILKCLHNECDDDVNISQNHSFIPKDLPVDLTDNLKQEIMEDFKILTDIYESAKNQSKNASNTSNYCGNKVEGNETFESEMKSFMNGTNTEVSGSVFDFNDRHNSTLKHEEKNLETSPLEENLIKQNIELKKELENVKLQYDLLQTDFELLKTETELQVKLETGPQEVERFSKENQFLQEELANSKLKHTEEMNQLNDNLEKLNLKIRELQKEKETILLEKSSLNCENETHKKNIEELKQKLEFLEDSKTKSDEATKNKLLLLEDKNSRLNGQLKINHEEKEFLQKELQTIKLQHIEEINRLNDNLEKLNLKSSQLQKENEKNNSLICEIEELKQSLQLLEKSKVIAEQTSNKLVSLEGENSSINERLDFELKIGEELKSEIEKINKENLNLKLQLEEFQTKHELDVIEWEEQCRANKKKIRELDIKIKFQKRHISSTEKHNAELVTMLETNETKYKKYITDLEARLSKIVFKEHDFNCITQKVEKAEMKIFTLEENLKKMEKAFEAIIGLATSEQESVLQVRPSQDYRDRFKDILKNLKINYTQLQDQLKLLKYQQPYDIEVIIRCLTQTKNLVAAFYNEEKLILKNNIKNLELSNEGYVQEIIHLRENQNSHKDFGCPQCLLLQAEITKSKNVLLEKENIDMQSFSKNVNKQDSKNLSLLHPSETSKRTLQEHKECSKNSVEVQCDILSEKYEFMKKLYQEKKLEARKLRGQIRALKSND